MAQSTNDPTHTDRIIAQGKALVRAIEALGTIGQRFWIRWTADNGNVG
jgi:hypothetical protein